MIQSAGIALVVKSLLGTSPISSLPYVLSLISPFTFGQTTFAINMVFVVFELLMLRRDFPAVFWLQIPVTILFGFCIDFFMNLFTIVPDAYALKLLLCLLGTALVALGVAGQGIADVLMLAGEGAVYVFARKFHIDFGKVKVGNDISLVILAAIVSVLTMGTIEGIRLVTVVLDSRFFMGSMSRAVGEKVTRAVEYADAHHLPLLIFSASGGARMQEGIYSLMQMAKTSAAIETFSEHGGLYISFLTHPTTGGVTASFATLGDITLAEPGALIGFAGPRVIEQTINRKLPKGFQRAEYLENHGFVDRIVKRSEMRDVLTDILKLHVDSGVQPGAVTTREVNA